MSPFRFYRPAVLCACLALAGCAYDASATSGAGAAEAAAPTLIVRGDRLFVPVTVNGIAGEALLDSGAEMTVLDAAYAGRIGLSGAGAATARGTGGETEASFAEGVDVAAAGVDLPGQTVAIIDLSDVSARLVGRQVDVILGRSLFDAARIEIDVEAGRIDVVSVEIEPQGVRLETRTESGLETIPVRIEGRDARAYFDLGNGSEAALGAQFAAEAGIDVPARIVDRREGGGIGGAVTKDIVRLETLELAGKTFTDIPASIDRTEKAVDANVGVRILRHYRITADFSEGAVWLDPLPETD